MGDRLPVKHLSKRVLKRFEMSAKCSQSPCAMVVQDRTMVNRGERGESSLPRESEFVAFGPRPNCDGRRTRTQRLRRRNRKTGSVACIRSWSAETQGFQRNARSPSSRPLFFKPPPHFAAAWTNLRVLPQRPPSSRYKLFCAFLRAVWGWPGFSILEKATGPNHLGGTRESTHQPRGIADYRAHEVISMS